MKKAKVAATLAFFFFATATRFMLAVICCAFRALNFL